MSFSGLDLERSADDLLGNASLQELAEALPDGLLLVDGAGRIKMANAIALGLNGVSASRFSDSRSASWPS